MLLRSGYPTISVRPADRNEYLDTLERASLQGDFAPVSKLHALGSPEATLLGHLTAGGSEFASLCRAMSTAGTSVRIQPQSLEHGVRFAPEAIKVREDG